MIGGYIRVSTEIQEKEGYSYADQQERFLQYASENDLPYKIYEDVQSGNDIDRPGYQALLNDIRAGKITEVWGIEESRFGRNTIESLVFRELLQTHNVKLIIAGIEKNISSTDGEFVYGLNALLSSRERNVLRERLRRGRNAKLRKGEKWFGPHLFGYDWVFDATVQKKVHKQNEEEIAVLKQMYKWFLVEKLPYKRIADRLNQKGIRGKLGTLWDSSKVSSTLNKTIYAGYYFQDEERIKSVNYPAVISPEEFQGVKEVAKQISSRYDRNIRYNYHQSSSLLFCWHCKQRMIFHHKKWSTPQGGEPRYKDIYKINHAKDCNRAARSQAVPESVLDFVFTKHYVDLISDMPSLVHFYKQQRQKTIEQDEEIRQEMARLGKHRESLAKKKKRLIQMAANSEDLENDPDIAEEITNLNNQISEVREQENSIKTQQELSKQELHRILSTIGFDAVKAYNDGDAYQRRLILSSVIKDAYIKDRLIHIEFVTGKTVETDLDELSHTLTKADADSVKRKEAGLLEDCIDKYIETFIDDDPNSDIDDLLIRKQIG
jgi:site-specific DNA recombinase